MSLTNSFYKRIFDYAHTTKIKVGAVSRHRGWKTLGLPDLRGFTPHLRTVNLYKGETFNKFNPSNREHLWLLHDILHVAFYDFVTIHLGAKSWSDPVRFLESHLASEAFAVLTLDYHGLVKTHDQTLTIDLKDGDWKKFQKINPSLPPLYSFDFCNALVNYYLEGQSEILNRKYLVGQSAKGVGKKFDQWLGHELRYPDKQRYYAMAWLEDLRGVKPSGTQAAVTGSSVAEPLWELLQLFSVSSEREWEKYLKLVKKERGRETNLFSVMPKYQKLRKKYDFRFTDIFSLPHGFVLENLIASKKPNASSLFLFWQILALVSPKELIKTQSDAVKALAASSQTSMVNQSRWNETRSICQEILQVSKWPLEPSRKGSFFLP